MPEPEPTLLSPEPAEPVTPVVEPSAPSTPATEPATAVPVVTPTVLATPVSPVKADGTFIENWKDSLPEELRSEKSLDTITDFNNMVKQLVSHKKMVGKDKVVLPTDKSDENDWNLFYEAIGRPKTETGYNTPEIPEEMTEIFTEQRLNDAKAIAYKMGATQKQFAEYLNYEMTQVAAIAENEHKAELATRANAEKELRTELGAAYDERMHVANRIVTEAFPKEEDRMKFLEKYGNDVDFIRFASIIGSRMSEHTALIGKLTSRTPDELKKRISTLQNTPGYLQIGSTMKSEDRQQITDELRDLNKQLFEVAKPN